MTTDQREMLYAWTQDAERRLRAIERKLFIKQLLREIAYTLFCIALAACCVVVLHILF